MPREQPTFDVEPLRVARDCEAILARSEPPELLGVESDDRAVRDQVVEVVAAAGVPGDATIGREVGPAFDSAFGSARVIAILIASA